MKAIILILAIFTIGFIACKKTSTAPSNQLTNVYCVFGDNPSGGRMFIECRKFNNMDEVRAAELDYRSKNMTVDMVQKPTCAECN